KGGQKGGWQRNVNIGDVDINGNTAVAKVDITDSKLKESGFVTLVKDNGSWKIASELSTLKLNK
ncbi:MAG: nuclear transport factor 2 family protein, partial [Ignavibacteriaceae bacterium]|nr:nuclear transport factor 2 family protein [Ignavibacteriaceae bacterium]